MKKADLVKILKILIKVIFSFLFASILVLYITLNIYVKSKELKVTPEEIKNECTVELNDWQIKCASEIITKNKNPKFARLPLITDAFSKRNAFAYHTAYSIYCEKIEEEKLKKIPTMEWRFMMLATKRYIVRHVSYKDCYNYMFSKTYFGLGMFGLKDISELCFNKTYDKLDKEEFEKICLAYTNPVKYDLKPEWEKTSFTALKETFDSAEDLIKNDEDREKLLYAVKTIFELQNYKQPYYEERVNFYEKDEYSLELLYPGYFKPSGFDFTKAGFKFSSPVINATIYLKNLRGDDLLIIIDGGGTKTNEVSETYSNRKASLNRFYSINIKEGSVKSMDFYWD